MQERIVITGMGSVNPLGLSVAESWRNALAGVSGIGPITLFDPVALNIKYACEVKNFSPASFLDPKEVRRRDRYELLAAAAVKEAMEQSGLVLTEENLDRIGVVISSAIGGMQSLQDAIFTLKDEGPRRVSAFLIPMLMSNGAAGLASIDHGLHGPSFSVASACASGADGIGMAWLMLRAGVLDVVVAGASEATICETGIAAFDRIGAMSRRESYAMTPQPFDRDRDGFVMGEGAAILILERESHARARGAVILAELAGYAATADAFHITAPSEEGSGAAVAIQQALKTAGVLPEQVGYVNAHGTGTPLNDVAETRALKRVFGEQAYKIPVSSTKSMTGHMMGATGALEAIFCVQVVREGVLPPTINYQTPDPDCDLDYVPNQAREKNVDIAISNALGFGGHNAVLVIRKYV